MQYLMLSWLFSHRLSGFGRKEKAKFLYKIPPPKSNLKAPTKTAVPHNTIPVIAAALEFPVLIPTMLKISPSNANGILNQLNHPNNGIKPIKNPIIEKIPMISPAMPIKLFLSFLQFN
jgi:hypothetical protein